MTRRFLATHAATILLICTTTPVVGQSAAALVAPSGPMIANDGECWACGIDEAFIWHCVVQEPPIFEGADGCEFPTAVSCQQIGNCQMELSILGTDGNLVAVSAQAYSTRMESADGESDVVAGLSQCSALIAVAVSARRGGAATNLNGTVLVM